jgi:hypothetical protein
MARFVAARDAAGKSVELITSTAVARRARPERGIRVCGISHLPVVSAAQSRPCLGNAVLACGASSPDTSF